MEDSESSVVVNQKIVEEDSEVKEKSSQEEIKTSKSPNPQNATKLGKLRLIYFDVSSNTILTI